MSWVPESPKMVAYIGIKYTSLLHLLNGMNVYRWGVLSILNFPQSLLVIYATHKLITNIYITQWVMLHITWYYPFCVFLLCLQGAQLRKHIDATLGSGNLREAVRLPPGEDINEWLAVNSNVLQFPFSLWPILDMFHFILVFAIFWGQYSVVGTE